MQSDFEDILAVLPEAKIWLMLVPCIIWYCVRMDHTETDWGWSEIQSYEKVMEPAGGKLAHNRADT